MGAGPKLLIVLGLVLGVALVVGIGVGIVLLASRTSDDERRL